MKEKKAGKAKEKSVKPLFEPIRAFRTQEDFAAWLEKNHDRSSGLWLRIAKMSAGTKSVTHPEALELALCYGWIDGIRRSESETAFLQRFVPRRAKSIWSKINCAKALALIEGGRMKPAGLAEVERAKADGRWDAAYDSFSAASVPSDFEKELQRHPKARAFFKTLNKTNTYAITWRLQTAKRPETRERRIRTFIEMLEKGETFH